MKLPTQVKNYIMRYETMYIPKYKTTNPGMKLQTLAWNYKPRHETTYPGMKLHTQAWNYLLTQV
jgi:hypothetical protein